MENSWRTLPAGEGRSKPATGIVFSGGGARGAYEAGVIAGLVEILGREHLSTSPFSIFCGASVGAINAAWLAAHAHEWDMNVHGLLDCWRTLSVDTHLQTDLLGLLGWRWGMKRKADARRIGRSLIDPRPLEQLVERAIPWTQLHDNVARGLVDALVVAALEIATGRTTLFAETAPDVRFRPSGDPRRVGRVGPIAAEHALASAALPLLFPARRIGDHFYCDGGIRFNTPIAPALRCGARRLVVVPLLYRNHQPSEVQGKRFETSYPNPLFLLGKVLDALLLDPVDYDLHVLERINKVMGTLEETLDAPSYGSVERVFRETRGLSYRKVDLLVFRPSEDIGGIAMEQFFALAQHRRAWRWMARFLRSVAWGDLFSFLLFDGEYADRLIALGRRDALDRRQDILAFFA